MNWGYVLSSDLTKKTVLKTLPLQATAMRATPAILLRATPAVLVLLAVSLIILHRVDALPVERLRIAAMDMAAPVLTAVSAPFSAAANSIGGVAAIRDLKADNIRLREENAKLTLWYESALKLQAENKSFRDLLNVKADPAITFVTARVISDAGGAFVKSVLIPIGLNDKIAKGNAVMSGHGLIGRVTEAGERSARVLLVTDLNSRIPVVLQNTRTKAILAGKNKDLMKLERLPPDSGMTLGTRVVTSGDGGQLPADLPIGTIVSIDGDGVWVKALSDIDQLSYVQVVNAETDPGLATGEITPAKTRRKK